MNFPLHRSSAPLAHLTPALWRRANRHLLAKAIAEFSHELLLAPQAVSRGEGWALYRLETPQSEYRFPARRLALDHWLIDAARIERRVGDAPAEPDALAFIVECRDLLGLSQDVLPVYLDEISSTLYGAAFKLQRERLPAPALALADYQALESGMTEGHPVFVANNGRIGFSDRDYAAWAPECGKATPIIWLAATKRLAEFSHVDGLDHARLMREELGEGTVARFEAVLAAQGLDPADYWFLPVHPWQWHHRLAMAFAADLAETRLVFLGQSEDLYAPQQSVRTLYNLSRPDRRYVKTALSILNMGFMRGLSPYYMSGTPAINQWLHALIHNDATLCACGFDILREEAAIGYRQPYYEAALAGNGPHKKQLAALWRESPASRLGPGERLMTMAALLHIDADGLALLPSLIYASGLSTEAWLRRYLEAYLRPLLHCFYQYDLVFMPHGENLILILDRHMPARVLMKDIAEEIGLVDRANAPPGAMERIYTHVPDELRTLWLLTDVFDCFFRFLAAILHEQGHFPETLFWAEVAGCVQRYQADTPHLADKFARYDLFAPTFTRSCLNRLQLANNRQMVNLADPSQGLQFHGTLENPIARFRPGAA
ncbi:MAG: IucA/IucC family siderophore biosynthesis protein [Paludibacterium sp.]|uniref:IucA/IucC family protein n=1 Tax=Paludibacterium sp. TaxID=1917523 RepID=UPI0025F1137D|nr:IucA/IucC family siderophore biosynthesis protein [Paludibacterium sp.]MBV8045746.1 IucA/IucC family siderophore biosynthesis protein [Paludibacterium sp.]